MTAATLIRRKSCALIAAHKRAARAGRDALVATRRAKWAIACDPGAKAVRVALERALAVQNRALMEAARADAVRRELAHAWGAR